MKYFYSIKIGFEIEPGLRDEQIIKISEAIRLALVTKNMTIENVSKESIEETQVFHSLSVSLISEPEDIKKNFTRFRFLLEENVSKISPLISVKFVQGSIELRAPSDFWI